LGQAWIRSSVIAQDLCTGCGACVNLCPYQKIHRDHTVHLHMCDRVDGRCRNYCPRSPMKLDNLRKTLFDPTDFIPELGPFKGLYLARSSDTATRSAAQHGGTVSTLMKLAFREGIVDTAILAGKNENHLPESQAVNSPEEVAAAAGSRFVVSPTVAGFNAASKGPAQKIGVVVTPCQALALAKMRANPWPEDAERTRKLALVIGLFCGWALSWDKLKALLAEEIGERHIKGMDIPPSGHACMAVYTDDGTVEIPIEKVIPCVREACHYCFDMTCEFSDISVGSARSDAGWSVDKGWNQVIVRSDLGMDLIHLAKENKLLEFKDVPKGNLQKLINASANKKKGCLDTLTAKTGSGDDLLYLDCEDAAVCRIQEI